MPTTKKTKVDRKKVDFELFAPEASEVKLAADFTEWDESATGMRKLKSGTWKKSVNLPEGAYQYRFIVDGEWQDDPNAELSEPNSFGTRNNVCVVM